MKSLDSIVRSITSSAVLDDLAELLRSHDPEFAKEELSYREAVEHLRNGLPENFTPSIDEFIAAAQTEVVANLLYAAYEGYRANLNNFHSPYATRFHRLDFTDYIRDHLLGHFPAALLAHNTCDHFRC